MSENLTDIILETVSHDAAARHSPRCPDEILSAIGAGRMGQVWKAQDTRLGRIVAIKLAAPNADRFDEEARAIAALNHPHICQVYDVGPDYLVLEYIEGHPSRGPLPADEALRLAMQIAGALEDAHSKGILHRDLKPANIMVTEGGSAKLLDFGLAKLMDADADVTRTVDGTVLGSLHVPGASRGETARYAVGCLQLRRRPWPTTTSSTCC